jgi:putative ABC transport system permease protein
MRLRRQLRLSVRALLAHRTRAALATGSVAIGVAAVLVTSALGQGARDEVLREVATMGTNLLVVRPAQVDRLVARKAVRGQVTSLRIEDCDEISALAAVREAAPGTEMRMRLKAGRGSAEALVLGTSSAFRSLRSLRLRYGRFFESSEDAAAQRVAVLGARVAETLFPGQDPTGAAIRIRGLPFEIVGVLADRGVLPDGSDEDGNVFVPSRTALRRLFNSTWLSAVFVSARDGRMDETEAEIRRLLRDRHRLAADKPDDFAIQSQAKLLALRETVADSLSMLAFGLAGASMLVSGTGVLALMLLSVKERTAEIGLRMAIGARRSDVFLQFFAEASLLALGGWLVGAIMAALTVGAMALASDWPVGLPVSGFAATLVVTAATGIGFGALPARKAARMPPIRALQGQA